MKKTMIRGGIIVLEDTLLTGYDLILEGHRICAITKTEKTKAEDAEILPVNGSYIPVSYTHLPAPKFTYSNKDLPYSATKPCFS